MAQELECAPESLDSAAAETIRGIAAEVFETMFFTEAEPADCYHGWLASAPCAGVRFEGSHVGEMLLGISPEAVGPVAASFLGIEAAEVTETLRGQVLQELSNILCGAMLSRLWPESKLSLAPPELTCWREQESALHRCLAIPEGRLAISLRLAHSGGPTEIQ